MERIIEVLTTQLGSREAAHRLVNVLETLQIGFVVGSEYDGPPIDRVEVLRSIASELGFHVYRPEDCLRGDIDTVIYDEGPDDGLLYFVNHRRGGYHLVPTDSQTEESNE